MVKHNKQTERKYSEEEPHYKATIVKNINNYVISSIIKSQMFDISLLLYKTNLRN